MTKTIASFSRAAVLASALALAAWACGGATTPPPLTPDGPDMDLDAAVYQDDSSSPAASGL